MLGLQAQNIINDVGGQRLLGDASQAALPPGVTVVHVTTIRRMRVFVAQLNYARDVIIRVHRGGTAANCTAPGDAALAILALKAERVAAAHDALAPVRRDGALHVHWQLPAAAAAAALRQTETPRLVNL